MMPLKMNEKVKSAFLTAEWRKLAMVNYAIDKNILEKFLPFKTEIDTWNDTCYVSLIGFMFVNTRLKGIKIPYHSDFEEINLRFYVRHKFNNEWKRGVVFIKEIVPRAMITLVANVLYHENYETMRTSHAWKIENNILSVAYQWKKQEWNSLSVSADYIPVEIKEGSEEEFITEHFWGYTKISDSRTSEYGVEHPRWKVYPVREFNIQVDFEKGYGKDFSFLSDLKPASVFLAEGSEIVVREGSVIRNNL